MTLPPRPLLAPAPMMTLRCHLLSLPVPMRLPHLYRPHTMSSTTSPVCRCLTLSTLFIRQSSKACTFPFPHRIQPCWCNTRHSYINARPRSQTFTPAPSLSFTSLPAAVSLQHDADLRTPFDAPNLSSLAPVLDDIIRTESHHSIIVTTSPNARPGPTSAPDLVASTEDDGSPQPGFRKETDVLDLPSVNRAIDASTTVTLDIRPQLPPVTDSDVAIPRPLLRNQTLSVQEIVPRILRVTVYSYHVGIQICVTRIAANRQ
ncbi:hypothetical protein EDB83DRAFT_2556248 [Lactarius deliciosus]|nr:hypothetical protein EDB83DRAFT_2556248 [Lactarius deliciosus]